MYNPLKRDFLEDWLSTIVLCFAVFICYNIWYFTKLRRCGIPGPLPVPFVGHALHQLKIGIGKSETLWAEKYGKIFGVYIGRIPNITIADLDILKQVFVKDFHNFTDRLSKKVHKETIPLKSGEKVAQDVNIQTTNSFVTKNLFSLGGDSWRRTRNIMSPTFSGGKLRLMCADITKCADLLTENLSKHADTGKSIVVKDYFGAFTMDVICCTAFGIDIESQKDLYNAYVKNANEVLKPSRTIRSLIALGAVCPPIGPLIRMIRGQNPTPSIRFFRETGEQMIAERQKDKVSRVDFMKLLLDARADSTSNGVSNGMANGVVKETVKPTDTDVWVCIFENELNMIQRNPPVAICCCNYGKKLTNGLGDNRAVFQFACLTTDEICAQTFLFFIAGYETTANLLRSTSYFLALHPDVDKRVCDEIQTNIGDAEITYDNVGKLKYLEQVLHEALRMYPAVTRINRVAAEEVTYKGITIPKGAAVTIPIYRIQHDPENFPNPEEFRPERFSPESKNKMVPTSFLAFGFGPRICLGMRLALVEAKIALVKVLSQLKFVPTAETQVPLQLNLDGLTRPLTPVKLAVVKRNIC